MDNINIQIPLDEDANNELMLAKISLRLRDEIVERFVNEAYSPQMHQKIRIFCEDFIVNESRNYPKESDYIINNIEKIFDNITLRVGVDNDIKLSRYGESQSASERCQYP